MQPQDFFPEAYTPLANAKEIEEILARAAARENGLLHEFEAYELFTLIGMGLPAFHYFPLGERLVDEVSQWMEPGKKYVVKCHVPGCLHKTDIGGIMLSQTRETVADSLPGFCERLKAAGHALEGVIVVEMANFYTSGMSGGELLISAYEDGSFGPCICFGMGGTAVEYYKKAMKQAMSQAFIPVFIDLHKSPVAQAAIERLPATQFLLGKVRGSKPQIPSIDEIINPLASMAELVRYFSRFNVESEYVIRELEINPTVVCKQTGKLLALDGVVRVQKNPNYGKAPREVSVFTAAKPLAKMGYLFCPQSVCLAGVSTKSTYNPCTVVINKLMKMPEDVRPKAIHCIHPVAKQIFGNPACSSVAEMLKSRNGEPVDLFIVGVPAAAAGPMMEDIIRLNAARAVFVMTGGFGETEAGKGEEKKLKAMLAELGNDYEHRPIINGPNTVGYRFLFGREDPAELAAIEDPRERFKRISTYDETRNKEMNTIFLASYKSSGMAANGRRNAALIAQSGAFMITRIGSLAGRVRPTACVSVGNQLCISATDTLEWLLNENIASQAGITDPNILALEEYKKDIQVYGLYLEGLNPNEGIRLMHLIAEARARNKLVVLYKAARTPQGSTAVAGHTAALAGDYSMFAELLDMAGGVITETADAFEDAYYLATCVIDRLPTLDKRHVAWVSGQSNAGYEKCSIADHFFAEPGCEKYMTLPTFDAASKAKIGKYYDQYKIGGVVDIQDILDTTAIIPDQAYEDISTALLESESVDAAVIGLIAEIHVICTLGGELGAKYNEDVCGNRGSVANKYIDIWNSPRPELHKPWVFASSGGWKYDIMRAHLIANGVPTFVNVDRAAHAMAKLIRAWKGRENTY